MTGRDLIIYILQNDLEDQEVYENGTFLGLISVNEAAIKFGVGVNTILAWHGLGVIDGVTVNNELYIFPNSNPKLTNGGTDV